MRIVDGVTTIKLDGRDIDPSSDEGKEILAKMDRMSAKMKSDMDKSKKDLDQSMKDLEDAFKDF